ncbi:MAG: choice-of-anchor tandem repeat GloVer-containing protein [Methylococcus sp.]
MAAAGELKDPLYYFDAEDGAGFKSALIMDAAGNLYGTTSGGGEYGQGTVFQLVPPGSSEAAWTRKVLLVFDGANGANNPKTDDLQAGLVRDAAGNLYGTTASGGAHGKGTVYQLIPPADGVSAWTLKTLVAFDGANGAAPYGNVTLDALGNLYGTTHAGGRADKGTVFQIMPPLPGKTAWRRKTLVTFYGANGAAPMAGVTLDAAGNLYGTAARGGRNDAGLVFQLSPPLPGKTAWRRKTLMTFNGFPGNGANPKAAVILDSMGKIYGTTYTGGRKSKDGGTVYQLTPPIPPASTWKRRILYSFDGQANVVAGVTLDAAGNLYGTTETEASHGMLYELVAPAPGKTFWKFRQLVDFSGPNGASPTASLLLGPDGGLYGTTNDSFATKDDFGTVFKYTP